jgi:predicted dehydrogenase
LIGAGVIGLNQGKHHCKGYFNSPNSQLLAVSDLIESRLIAAKKMFPGITAYYDYKEMLKRTDIDVVSVTVPPFLHPKISLDAINHGKNVIVEKPLALTLEDCDEIINAAKEKHVKLSVQFNKRFHPLFSKIKTLIDKGELGRIAAVSISYWRFPFGATSKPGKWSGQRKYAGNMLFEDGIHWLDLMRWFAGEVTKVNCIDNDWVRNEFNFSQTAFLNLTFKGGAIGNFSQTITGFGNRSVVWVMGTKACILGELVYSQKGDTIVMLFKKHQKELQADRKLDLVKTTTYPGIIETYDQSITAHFNDFVNRLNSSRDPLVTGLDGRSAVEICLAAEKSAFEKTPVSLPLKSTPNLDDRILTKNEVQQYLNDVHRR